MKYTHFTENEITGEYYKEAKSELPWTLVTVAVIAGIAVIIIEWTGLADYLLGSLMG